MSHGAAVAVMMSNYFHDVATAMIMACSVALWRSLVHYERHASLSSREFLLRLYRGISRLVIFSWIWIISAGLIRALTFGVYEWPNAVAKHQEYGLEVKYGIALAMMVSGAFLWRAAVRRMRAMIGPEREGQAADPAALL